MSKNLANEDLMSLGDDTPPRIKIKRRSKTKNVSSDNKKTYRKRFKKLTRQNRRKQQTDSDWQD